jgi:hypothetical protein
MALALLAHGGTAGALAEGAGVLLGLAALSVLVWRSTRKKIEEYEPAREPVEEDRPW